MAGVRRRHQGHECQRLLRDEGQLEPGGDPAVRRAGGRRRHRLGGRDAARPCGRHPGRAHHLFRRRQEGFRADGSAAGRGGSDQRRELVRARDPERGGGAARRRRRHHHPGQPRCRCRHPRQDHHGAQGEQVRHRYRPRPRCLRPGRPPAQPAGGRGRHAYRLPADLARPLPQRHRAGARADRPAQGRRPCHRPVRHRRRPGHRLCRREAALDPRLSCNGGPRNRWAGLRADVRAGPTAGRRGWRAGRRGHPGQARRGQDLRHRRCGDERSHPADVIRGVARHRAGPGAPRCRHDPL